jgi:hypothetical protein
MCTYAHTVERRGKKWTTEMQCMQVQVGTGVQTRALAWRHVSSAQRWFEPERALEE